MLLRLFHSFRIFQMKSNHVGGQIGTRIMPEREGVLSLPPSPLYSHCKDRSACEPAKEEGVSLFPPPVSHSLSCHFDRRAHTHTHTEFMVLLDVTIHLIFFPEAWMLDLFINCTANYNGNFPKCILTLYCPCQFVLPFLFVPLAMISITHL